MSDSLLFVQNPAYDESVILAFHQEVSGELYAGALQALYALDSLHPDQPKYRQLAAHFIDRSKSDVLFRFLPDNLSSDSLRVLKSRIDRLSAEPQRPPLSNRQLAYDMDAIENFGFARSRESYQFADVQALQTASERKPPFWNTKYAPTKPGCSIPTEHKAACTGSTSPPIRFND